MFGAVYCPFRTSTLGYTSPNTLQVNFSLVSLKDRYKDIIFYSRSFDDLPLDCFRSISCVKKEALSDNFGTVSKKKKKELTKSLDKTPLTMVWEILVTGLARANINRSKQVHKVKSPLTDFPQWK